ncbi:hypothetical protein NC652_008405 [Populus alba x Populus x berolinensis]|nr:hypothetical protein NC652_008405 [Populus alba x Populus x berolinensis]
MFAPVTGTAPPETVGPTTLLAARVASNAECTRKLIHPGALIPTSLALEVLGAALEAAIDLVGNPGTGFALGGDATSITLLAEWSASSAMPQETSATQLHTRYNFPISGYEINVIFNSFMAFKMILIAFGLSQLIYSSLGALNVKLSKLGFGRGKFGNLQQRSGARVWMGRGQLQYAGVAISHKSRKAFRCCGSASEAEWTTKETTSLAMTSQLIPNSSEIESLVAEICNTTSIAEFELKLGGFRLYVMRDLTEKNEPTPQPLPPPPLAVTVKTTTDASDLNGSASTSLAISKQEPSFRGIKSFLDRAADEGVMILQSPRVGFFRRSRTIKGKHAPPSCKEVPVHEKQIIKEGQVLCYIEQLGGELPIESDISGEVIKILREDGEPVGYGDTLIVILPSFPGIKKLQ